jgi:hypothetical protein
MAKLKKFTEQQLKELVVQVTSWRQLSLALDIKGGSGYKAVVDRVTKLGFDTSHFTGKAWNKGLTKETNESVARCGEKGSLSLKGKSHPHTLESRQKISRSASERSWTNGIVRTRWYDVVNPFTTELVKVQGTWEKAYAEYLNKNQVRWEKSKTFSFGWKRSEDDIEHTYHPDFYLPDSDTYVEIKGFMWKSKDGKVDDQLKLKLVKEQNPQLKLLILMKEDLKNLGILK